MKDSTRRLMKQLKHQHKSFAGGPRKSRRSILKAVKLIRQDQRCGHKA